MTETTIIDLMRHGEPLGGSRYRGQTDDALSDKGWQEMWYAIGDTAPWDHIITSPLKRCAEFARALGEWHDIEVEEEPRFMEVHFGAWESYTGDELRAQDPQQLKRFYHDPVHARPANAEPLEAFAERAQAALVEVMERFRSRHVLVVAHAGVVRAAVAYVLGAPLDSLYRMEIASASLTRLRLNQERPWNVLFVGRPRLDV